MRLREVTQEDYHTLELKVRTLEDDVSDLQRDIKLLRGDGGRARLNGDLDMGGRQIINLAPSGTSDMAVARDELEDILSEALNSLILKEDIATTGTAHQLANVPYDSTKVILMFNGAAMENTGTGQMGYTITAAGAITTVHSVETEDEFFAIYRIL